MHGFFIIVEVTLRKRGMFMKKTKRLIIFSLIAYTLVSSALFSLKTTYKASADVVQGNTYEDGSIYLDEDIETRGLFTSLSLTINGGEGKVWTTVKNDVTLFPATVQVILELYRSDTYQEKYENMTLVERKSIKDLNMGKTLTVEGSTDGKEMYWLGRMRYKIDNKSWATRETGTMRYDSNGNFVDIT